MKIKKTISAEAILEIVERVLFICLEFLFGALLFMSFSGTIKTLL